MKLSDYIAEFLSKITDSVFVGQGGNIIHVLDSLGKRKDIKVIPSQNEQGASIAADAYSRFNDKIGVTAATSGPGMLNLMQGMACSFFDSIPTFHFSGAVVSNQLRKNKKIRQIGFQEMEVVDLVKPITKYAVLLKDKNNIRYELEKMLHFAKEGRPGPVLMDLPDDLQRAEINPKKLKRFTPPVIKKKKIIFEKKFLELIRKAKRPIIILGHGVNLSNTKNDVKKLISKTGIPFLPSWATIDLFPHDNKLNAGTFGVAATRYGNFAVQNCDLLISLGCRLNTQITGSNIKSFAPNAKKIVIDIDDNEFKKNNGLKIDLKINLDLKVFFKKIIPLLKDKKNYGKWIDQFKIWKEKYPVTKPEYYNQAKNNNAYVFMKKLSDKTGKNDVLIPDASANLIWAMQSFQLNGQKVFTALNHSPMGYSMPATIGAYLADKSKNVICTIGDGSMQMNIQELATIAHFNFPVKIFVINNGGYGLIKQTQDMWLGSRRVGVDESSGLAMPDLKNIAKAYKIKTVEINNHNDLDEKLDYVLKSKEPILCEVKVNENQKVIPKLEFGRAIHDLSPRLEKKELESNMAIK
ncbi:thiamine pyrophosphate-binding protein [Candidatus Pelagibacter sp.]|jgi:acetolactate synthase I/II/III large subunit|nr:thiamine pyrophosphate-binding protein [Candidatus Pelagibacter sp.]|tara:strand:+ start:16419 stop:18155 length:1737 start_codon:yes stop_codon:yes gene_type:complete